MILANTNEDLELLMDKITSTCEWYGLKMNIRKTKYMIISKKTSPQDNGILVSGIPIEKVNKLTYLGSNINDGWDPSVEIKIRIEQARRTFIRMKKALCSRDISLNLSMEAWTLNDSTLKRLEAFEMWVYRHSIKNKYIYYTMVPASAPHQLDG